MRRVIVAGYEGQIGRRDCAGAAPSSPRRTNSCILPCRYDNSPPGSGRRMILLIGGNGFIGRHLAALVRERGLAATVVTRRAASAAEAYGDGTTPVIDAETFAGVAGDRLLADAEAVVYLASGSVPSTFAAEPWREIPVNVEPAARLFARCATVNPAARLVLISSGGTVYGQTGGAPVTEDAPTQPISGYGWGKLMIEQALAFVGRTRGLLYNVLRVSNAVGRWQDSNAQGIVSIALRAARDRTPIDLYGGGVAGPGLCRRRRCRRSRAGGLPGSTPRRSGLERRIWPRAIRGRDDRRGRGGYWPAGAGPAPARPPDRRRCDRARLHSDPPGSRLGGRPSDRGDRHRGLALDGRACSGANGAPSVRRSVASQATPKSRTDGPHFRSPSPLRPRSRRPGSAPRARARCARGTVRTRS